MPVKQTPKGKTTPQSLYTLTQKKHEEEEKKEKKIPFFISLTHSLGSSFKSLGRNAKFNEDQEQNFAFLGWEITAEEFYASYKALFMFGLLAGVVAAGLLYFFLPLDQTLKNLAAAVCLLIPIGGSYFYLTYPGRAVEHEKIQSLAYIPEIVNYLVMSMRLTPNLEKAVQFAANHGQGKVSEDLKKIVWDVQIGRYLSIEEGLDDLAYKWGSYNEDFKHALMLIRASVLEKDYQRRESLLQKASDDVLEGAREKMDLYARRLHQPTVYLYYFGILLPLLLAIILPIGGSMTGADLAKPEYLILAYNIFLPILIYFFGRSILAGRPPTYVPPNIPSDYPGLPAPGVAKFLGMSLPYVPIAIILFLACLFIGFQTDQGVTQDFANGFVVWTNGILSSFDFELDQFSIAGSLSTIPSYLSGDAYDKAYAALTHLTFFDENDLALGPLVIIPKGIFIGQFTIFGFLIGFSLMGSVYLLGRYGARKKAQDSIREMENEFKDAMYVLASRLGENKPIEDALRQAVQFLPKSQVSRQVFKRILENITTLGMTLDSAIFDETFGALKNMPSRVIRGGMQFLVDSVELGVNVAAKSLINLAMQLRNSQKIDESLKKLLEDVTVMLKTMSTYVAPIVLGVVAAMQHMIVSAMSANECADTAVSGSSYVPGSEMMSAFCSSGKSTTADPATFVLIMGIYVIEVVALLTYF
ncbi:MAG: hypothetical protein V1834_03775, partial [Candidatus Micrarchaeota archaeon]